MVIAIIAILAAILFPILVSAKARSQQIKCLSNLRQLAVCMRSYGVDWNGRFPYANEWGQEPTLPTVLRQYVGTKAARGIFVCPADVGARWEHGGSGTVSYAKQYRDTSYGWAGFNFKTTSMGPWLSTLSMENPVDPAGYERFPQWRWIWDLPLSKRNMIWDHNPWHSLRGTVPSGNRLAAQGLNCVVYVDGHAKVMDYQKFLQYLWGNSEPK